MNSINYQAQESRIIGMVEFNKNMHDWNGWIQPISMQFITRRNKQEKFSAKLFLLIQCHGNDYQKHNAHWNSSKMVEGKSEPPE